MKYYPVCLQIQGKRCLVVGGGRVAARKTKGLLDSGAKVTVVSPKLVDSLFALFEQGTIAWEKRGYRLGDVVGAFLVMAATDDHDVQDTVLSDANKHNVLLNVADVPEKCNFILPAQVKRGNLSIAISTSGNSPALAKKMRRDLELQFGEEFEVLNDLMGILRPLVLGRQAEQQENEAIFNRLLKDDILQKISQGSWDEIKNHIEGAIGSELPVGTASSLEKLVAKS